VEVLEDESEEEEADENDYENVFRGGLYGNVIVAAMGKDSTLKKRGK
jgi:hypothetical protein